MLRMLKLLILTINRPTYYMEILDEGITLDQRETIHYPTSPNYAKGDYMHLFIKLKEKGEEDGRGKGE